MNQHKIAILGSTGSIGTQALEIARSNPDRISIEVLTAHSNADLLITQRVIQSGFMSLLRMRPNIYRFKEALSSMDIKVFTGHQSISDVMGITDADTVLTAMVGYSGLAPTISAIRHKKRIALANKETLVVAGELITRLCNENRVEIIPVDSEHSAIFQCLVGEELSGIEHIYLTASGGPFRGQNRQQLQHVTRAQALKHPNWSMGAKITIDSATLMNKGFEVIEAKWLFGLHADQIKVVVHPQSIIHSMVSFHDSSIKAQLGLPDMKLPIHYAFFYPERVKTNFKRMSFMDMSRLDFELPDTTTFNNLNLAYSAMQQGGNMACVLNAANEIAVDAFLKDQLSFLGIADLNEECMQKIAFIANPTLEDYIQTDRETRMFAKTKIRLAIRQQSLQPRSQLI